MKQFREKFESILEYTKANKPLIHCMTNAITINLCANGVLAIGARPIMATNKREVHEIVDIAGSLAVNIGCASDEVLLAMNMAGKRAKEIGKPCIYDPVGAGATKLRMDFSMEFISECAPTVIKGNYGEIEALCKNTLGMSGVDSQTDTIDVEMIKEFSKKTGAIIVATGEVDVICQGEVAMELKCGHSMLSNITGTGCLLNCIIASLLPSGDYFNACILGTAILGICGEIAYTKEGTGSFQMRLLDALSTITLEQINEKIKMEA